MKLRLTLPTFLVLVASALVLRAADPALTATRQGPTLRLTWPTNTLGFRLESLGDLNLSNWTAVLHVQDSNLFRADETIGGSARFYRLINDCNPGPDDYISVPAVFRRVNNNAPTVLPEPDLSTLPLVHNYVIPSFPGDRDLAFDVSQAFNPRTCSTNGLRFSWTIEYESPDVAAPYRVAGITGYETPVLRINANSLVFPPSGTTTLMVRIYDPLEPYEKSVFCRIIGSVSSTGVTLEQFNTCRTQTNACTNPNLLPVPP